MGVEQDHETLLPVGGVQTSKDLLMGPEAQFSGSMFACLFTVCETLGLIFSTNKQTNK